MRWVFCFQILRSHLSDFLCLGHPWTPLLDTIGHIPILTFFLLVWYQPIIEGTHGTLGTEGVEYKNLHNFSVWWCFHGPDWAVSILQLAWSNLTLSRFMVKWRHHQNKKPIAVKNILQAPTLVKKKSQQNWWDTQDSASCKGATLDTLAVSTNYAG